MKWNRYVAYLWTWPFDVTIWLVFLLPYLLWGERLRWEDGSVVFNWKRESLPGRKWDWGGTTLGHFTAYNWWVDPRPRGPLHRLQVHERFHQKQHEAYMLASFLQAVLIVLVFQNNTALIYGAIHWWAGYVWMFPNFISAWQRGERFYRDSHHEVAAYALDKYYQRTGETVLDANKTF